MDSGDENRSSGASSAARPWIVALWSEDGVLGRQLAQSLRHEDFRFSFAHPQTTEGPARGWTTFDLVLLHVAHPRTDASMLRAILRTHPSCVVVLGHRATGIERAWWIENGADDCLSQPCDKQELLARLRASIRRRVGSQPSAPVKVGFLTVSPSDRTATLAGRRLALTTCEFSLLVTLARHAGQVLDREQLLEFATGSAEQAFERSIDVQISRLRAKLRDSSRHPRILKTVRGVGYVLVADHLQREATTPLFQNVSVAKALASK
jgi:DNA-binding response OmpR family regulator